ncbi:MAG TPA: hypothetical protein PL158_11270 [Bacillota bacterium]|nr:hypothetical protein [Bacillota bacterium]HOL10244.1 hypothetical protein [Bacillota bacterium]
MGATMKPEKQRIVNSLKAAEPEEVHKIFKNPEAYNCLSMHSLGFPTYLKCIKALYPEYNPKTPAEMESLLQNIHQQYQAGKETETNTKAKIVIAIISNHEAFKKCLGKNELPEECLNLCNKQYEFTKTLFKIKKACERYDSQLIQGLFDSNPDLFLSCLTYNYMTREEYYLSNKVIKKLQEKNVNEIYSDDKNFVLTLLAQNWKLYQDPIELYRSLEQLLKQDFNTNGLVKKCFTYSNIKCQKDYIEAGFQAAIEFPEEGKKILKTMQELNPFMYNIRYKKLDTDTKRIIAAIKDGTFNGPNSPSMKDNNGSNIGSGRR